ncbi:MAG: spore coat protein [Syntrophomonadaceae bacterium]|jgi:spore coat protein CotF|nr:spore coat protein [Syntrophomonadaceae bacterium]
MINDTLSMVNSSLSTYAGYITETADQQLRQALQQIRNADEQAQFKLFQIANQKGFYKPAAAASPQEIQQVKSQLN